MIKNGWIILIKVKNNNNNNNNNDIIVYYYECGIEVGYTEQDRFKRRRK